MGTPHTYDVCDYCGLAIVNLNNAGTWTHVETDGVKNGIPATECVVPNVRLKATTQSGKSINTHAKAGKLSSGRRDQQ